jgi:hypothetical protein
MNVLEKLGIQPGSCVIEGVQKVGEHIQTGENPESRLEIANDLIRSMGGVPEDDSDHARIVSKYMIAQMIEGKTPDQKLARARTMGLLKDAKYFYHDRLVVDVPKPVYYVKKTDRVKGGGNKFIKIKEFVRNTKLTDRGEVLRAIEAELGYTYSNAYFYCRKAEKELGVTFTAKKGKKKKAK